MLKKISQFPIRHQFKDFIDDYSNLKKISEHWIKAQEKINLDGKLGIYKTHNGNYYRYSIEKTPLNFILDKKFLINKFLRI